MQFRVIVVTDPQTQDRLQYTAPQLGRSVITNITMHSQYIVSCYRYDSTGTYNAVQWNNKGIHWVHNEKVTNNTITVKLFHHQWIGFG